jgi:exopolysaccharide production protein ExoY
MSAEFGDVIARDGTAYFDDILAPDGRENASGVVREGAYQGWAKRCFDLLIVALLVPIVAPITIICVLLMRRDGAPGLYRQKRIGRGGKSFYCWKIRTMVPNAEAALAELIRTDASCSREWQATQKLRYDPRITRIGRVLRKTSIDELPQLWNVVLGDMSLIGPRPFLPDQQAVYDGAGARRAYYDVRPGITGLWQVQSRNDGTFTDRIWFDEAYCGNLNLIADLVIVAKTLRTLFRVDGR